MSKENLDALRRSNESLTDGDVDGALELWDPQVVYHEQPGTPLDTGEVLRGLDQVRASLMAYLAEFPDFHSEIDELVDAGDKVVCVQRWLGTGRGSGLSVEFAEVIVLTFENGKIIEGRVYPDRGSAVEAAGVQKP
jgi:ketosteroid isomerase-like protein